jgi:beta-1,4-N-acetylglucosaminyltransferase
MASSNNLESGPSNGLYLTPRSGIINHIARSVTEANYGGLPTIPDPDMDRHCLVTVGATTTFRTLVEGVLERPFISALITAGYTRLTIQCGADAEQFRNVALQFVHPTLKIDVIDYVDDLSRLMRKCRAAEGLSRRRAGMMICHAGMFT